MDIIGSLLQHVFEGGSTAVISILLIVIGVLIYDRRNLSKSLEDTTKKAFEAKDNETKSIREIVERYHRGNLDLVQALNEIKVVLTTIQNSKR